MCKVIRLNQFILRGRTRSGRESRGGEGMERGMSGGGRMITGKDESVTLSSFWAHTSPNIFSVT